MVGKATLTTVDTEDVIGYLPRGGRPVKLTRAVHRLRAMFNVEGAYIHLITRNSCAREDARASTGRKSRNRPRYAAMLCQVWFGVQEAWRSELE